MDNVRRNWIGLLVVAVAIFYVTLGVVWVLDSDQTTGEKLVGYALTFVPAAALLVGLWRVRDGNATAARIAIAIGLVPTVIFWWMIFPVLAAAAVGWFGLVRGGFAPKPA